MLNKDPNLTVKHYEYVLFPEFYREDNYVWAFSPHSPHETLALTWSALADALTEIILLRPQYLHYIERVFELNNETLKVFNRKK